MKIGGISRASRAGILCTALLALLFSLFSPPARAQDEEHELIAVFIVNFLNFAIWPGGDAAGEKKVCVYGNDKIIGVVAYITDKKKLPLKPVRLDGGEPIDDCSILFISKNKRSDADGLLQKAQKKAILTASDITGFASNGGMIEFVKNQNKFKLRVNVRESKAHGIGLDPSMLQLAELVE